MMDNLYPILGLGVLVIINLVAVAVSYGKHSQKLNDVCQRIGRIENWLNGRR